MFRYKYFTAVLIVLYKVAEFIWLCICSYSEWMLVLRLSRQSLPLVITWSNQSGPSLFFSFWWRTFALPRVLFLKFCLTLFSVCFCSSPFLVSLRFLNLSSFLAAVSAARRGRSLSLLRWSFFFSRSWRLHINSVNERWVNVVCNLRKFCHYACALIEKY